MSDEEQDSGKFISSSKLSASVPAFIPGITHSGATSPVINSNLSPLVPEFHPSVSFTPVVSSFNQATHSKKVYVKHGKIDVQQKASLQAYQPTPPLSKKIPGKTEKPSTGKKNNRTHEGEAISENTTNENLTESSVSVNKKKRHRKKKESHNLFQEQGEEELSSKSLKGSQQESDGLKDVSSRKTLNGVSSNTNEVTSSLQQNCTPILSSSEKSDSQNTEDKGTSITGTDFESLSSRDHQSGNKKPFLAPTFTMSYSDKVKSLSPRNSSTSNQSVTAKSWVKDFTPEGSRDKDKHIEVKQNSEFHVGHNTRTVKSDDDEKRTMKSGRRADAVGDSSDFSRKTVCEDSEYYKLKYGDSSKSQSLDAKQNPRTAGKQVGRNSSFKKITCDDDNNWRVKKDVDPTISHIKSEPLIKSNMKNHNTESLEKRTSQQEGIHVDVNSKKYEKDVKHEKSVGGNVLDEKGKSSRKQQNLHDPGTRSTEQDLVSSPRFPVSKLSSDLPSSSQDDRLNRMKNTSAVAASNNDVMGGEFPNLKESVRIKRSSNTEERTVDHKDVVTSLKPTAPMSYSAVLRSAPRPKVAPAWEDEHPRTHGGGGLLKVPPQAVVGATDNEADQGESSQKKKKKKKKKKSAESGGQPQGSAKRTKKPIEFNLGTMLQTISKSSTDRPQPSGKKVVVATGVLPSQLSTASAQSPADIKPGVKSPPFKKGDNKIPHNKLDSTAPIVKRGKERETPARKKPSALKKIILKEREEKKKARETTETDNVEGTCEGEETGTCESEVENIVLKEIQSQSEDETTSPVDPEPSSPTDKEIAAEIHSRRFREYCFQVPDKEVDAVATELLRELVRFQDRQFHKDPVKAKAKRRFVLGLREVNKHLKLRKLKCVIISSNVERIKSVGGLDDTLGSIITLCRENKVPVVFALKRQLLGKVLLKKVPVSIVGIFNYDGAQEHFKTLIELSQKTRQAYTDKWQETREKLELQQKEALDVKATEMDNIPNAEVQQAAYIPRGTYGDAGTKNELAECTESSSDEDSDVDAEENEQKYIILENDLEIQDL